ncbi:hypothetical protein [Vibrio rotiferianus]|uniref:hypothetical protein n=1 Tax=Vibrio rotiferianus TaxID=190895 RepID=UPI000B598BDF|nr:hypothetical protein [Vibrio rotiferianus]ASI93596.1 hypothetical protein BSZ04_00795 [Vibrio rotiferianus]
MQIKFLVNDVEVSEKPQNGEQYVEERWVNGRCAVRIEATATTPEQRTQQKIEEEKAWRNQELAYIDSQSYGESFPYFTQVEDYKQALRDYPMQPDFPYGDRPVRPTTPSGSQIIN